MIYVTLGTQKFEFNRVLEYIDKAIENGLIQQELCVQAGYSSYEPKNYTVQKFIEKDEVERLIDESEFIISHGGSGSIIDALRIDKKMIIIPRDEKYGEHIDNHQFELVDKFYEKGLILKANTEDEFFEQLKRVVTFKPCNINEILHDGKKMKCIVDDFIKLNFKKR